MNQVQIQKMKQRWQELHASDANELPVSFSNTWALIEKLERQPVFHTQEWHLDMGEDMGLLLNTDSDPLTSHAAEINILEDGTMYYYMSHDGFVCSFEDPTDPHSRIPASWRQTDETDSLPFSVDTCLELMDRWEKQRVQIAWEITKGLLLSTKRPGITSVVSALEESDFITAPASRADHSPYPGGLLIHSIQVYHTAKMLVEDMKVLKEGFHVDSSSLILTTLLHDVCKINTYQPEPGGSYSKRSDDFPIGHGEKSAMMLLMWGLELSKEELLAIRYHMGPYDLQLNKEEIRNSHFIAERKFPLVSILHTADTLSTCIVEQSCSRRAAK